MRYIIFFVSVVFVVFTVISCGEEETEDLKPTTGTISGTVTFVGTPPAGKAEIQVSIFSTLVNGRPAGPPDRFSEPFTQFTGQVPYTISGVAFGTYQLAAVGYENPDNPPGTPETILGMYGFKAPSDMEPDSFAVSEDKPEATGIDITADYSAIKSQ